MTATIAPAHKPSFYEEAYDPEKVLRAPEFRVIKDETDPALKDKSANIACAYNPAHEIHLVQKPGVKPRKGEVIVHVRSTGICGWVSADSCN